MGSLEVGKKADFVLFDLDHIEWTPFHDPLQALVFSATSAHSQAEPQSHFMSEPDDAGTTYAHPNISKQKNHPQHRSRHAPARSLRSSAFSPGTSPKQHSRQSRSLR